MSFLWEVVSFSFLIQYNIEEGACHLLKSSKGYCFLFISFDSAFLYSLPLFPRVHRHDIEHIPFCFQKNSYNIPCLLFGNLRLLFISFLSFTYLYLFFVHFIQSSSMCDICIVQRGGWKQQYDRIFLFIERAKEKKRKEKTRQEKHYTQDVFLSLYTAPYYLLSYRCILSCYAIFLTLTLLQWKARFEKFESLKGRVKISRRKRDGKGKQRNLGKAWSFSAGFRKRNMCQDFTRKKSLSLRTLLWKNTAQSNKKESHLRSDWCFCELKAQDTMTKSIMSTNSIEKEGYITYMDCDILGFCCCMYIL